MLEDATGALVRAALVALAGASADEARVMALDPSRAGLDAIRAKFTEDVEAGRLLLAAPGQGACDGHAVRCVLGRLPKSLAALQARMLELRAARTVILGGRTKHLSRSQNEVLATTHAQVRATRGLGKSRALVGTDPRGDSAEPTRPAVVRHELPLLVGGEQRSATLCGIGGVFGGASADAGSMLLLDALEIGLGAGDIDPGTMRSAVDLGCGNGLLTSWLAMALPDASIRASDDDADAVVATRATLEASGLSRDGIEVAWETSLADAAAENADLVVMNPPFHDGTAIDATLVQDLLDAAGRVLRPGGQLWMVHNSLLRYRDEVEDRIGPVRERVRDRRFTVLSAQTRAL